MSGPIFLPNRIGRGGPLLASQLPASGATNEARVPLVMPTPQYERRQLVDRIPNLLISTLAYLAILPPGQQVSASTPTNQAKYQVQVDQPVQHPLTLGFNPQPQVRQWDSSAPPRTPVYVDQPLFHPLTLGINPQPTIQQLSASAPITKYAIEVDAYSNLQTSTFVSGAPKIPPGLQLNIHVAIQKYAIKVDAYPNLQFSTLLPRPFRSTDTSQLQPKYAVQVDFYPNLLVPSPPPSPPPPAGSMPNVVGLNYYMAIKALQSAGIYVPLAAYAYTTSTITVKWAKSNYAGGIVSAQSIAAGTIVPPNQPVTLTVSTYPFGSDIDSPPDWKQRLT